MAHSGGIIAAGLGKGRIRLCKGKGISVRYTTIRIYCYKTLFLYSEFYYHADKIDKLDCIRSIHTFLHATAEHFKNLKLKVKNFHYCPSSQSKKATVHTSLQIKVDPLAMFASVGIYC